MNKKELRKQVNHFDVSDIEWEIHPSNKKNEIKFTMKCETRFNNLKILLGLQAMIENMRTHMGIEELDGDPEDKH